MVNSAGVTDQTQVSHLTLIDSQNVGPLPPKLVHCSSKLRGNCRFLSVPVSGIARKCMLSHLTFIAIEKGIISLFQRNRPRAMVQLVGKPQFTPCLPGCTACLLCTVPHYQAPHSPSPELPLGCGPTCVWVARLIRRPASACEASCVRPCPHRLDSSPPQGPAVTPLSSADGCCEEALTGEDSARVKCFINSTCACVHSALERVQGVGGCGQKKLTHAFQQVLPLSQVPLGEPSPRPRFLLPSALCAEHPLPFHLDLPLLSHLVEMERKDRELKRRLSREG